MPATTTEKLGATDLARAIAKAHEAPAWACLFEVKNQTGYQLKAVRFADAIAMSLYPSRGLYFHGFEIKVDRGDWLRELKDPAKAEEIARYCHFWWVVTPREGVIVKGEIPDAWGWKVLEGGRLMTKKEPRIRTPEAASPNFLAALLRRATEGSVPKSQVEDVVTERLKLRAADIVKQAERTRSHKESTYDHLKAEHDELKRQVCAFQETTGVNLNYGRWFDGKRIGDAVNAVLRHQPQTDRRELERLAHMAEAIAARTRGYLKATEPQEDAP